MVSVENSETSNLIRNIVLIGSTGAGKSTTGNYILTSSPQGPFQVSDEEISCTVFAEEQISKSKNIRVIDTPGFGDNRFSEKDIDKIIRELALILSDPRVDSTGQIDAFILPVKFNPRPAALKTDLEHFIDLFGKIALKSMILLLIFDKPGKTKADVLKAFNMMTEIVRIIKEGKDEEPNENWFCIWDNINPLPDQETELFEKVSALEPYTHKKFVEADQEIKARLDAKVKAEVDRLITRAKRDYEDDKKAQEQKIKEIGERFQRERKELIEARERAQNDTAKFIEAMQRMGEQNKAEMEQLYLKMRTEREENQKKTLATIKSIEERNNQETQAIIKQKNEIMANFQNQIAEMANRQAQMYVVAAPSKKKKGCNMF